MPTREELAFQAAKDHNLGLLRTKTGWAAVEPTQHRTVGAEAATPEAALENGKVAIEAAAARKANDAALVLQEALQHGRFYPQPFDKPGGDIAWSVKSRSGREMRAGLNSWLEAARLIVELDNAEVAREKGQGSPARVGV